MSHLRMTDEQIAERAKRINKAMVAVGARIETAPAKSTPSKPKGSKYKAVRTTVDGVAFHSKKEAARYMELRLMEKSHEIVSLRLQVPYPIYIKGHKICDWRADFVYDEYAADKMSQTRVVEDCKGYRTDVYKLKKKMVEAEYGFKIKET